MSRFTLNITLVLLAFQGKEAKVTSCLSCDSMEDYSECAKGTGTGGTIYDTLCFQAQPVRESQMGVLS